MNVDPLSDEIRAFIAGHIRSLRALEFLLLLHADPAKEWTAQEVSNELRASPQWADEELQFFLARGLLVKPDPNSDRVRYFASRPELEKAVAELGSLYPVHRFAIIQSIFAGQADPVQQFADAFRIRKEKPDG